MSNRERDLLLPVVPQQFGEAVQMWGEGTINCGRDAWDNRTTAENAVWLLLRLEEERDALMNLIVQPWDRDGDGDHHWKINLAWWDTEDTQEEAVARVRKTAKLDAEPIQP